MAYYPVQVEKFLARFEAIAAEGGEAALRATWNPEEAAIAEEFLTHARAIRAEREAAQAEGREARVRELVQSWGGVTIAYRRELQDSPSYRLNHEEVALALEEGISFSPGLTPVRVEVDGHGHAAGLVVKDGEEKESTLPARAILVAAGTQPNTVLAREDTEHLSLDGKYFQAFAETGTEVEPERLAKPAETDVLMHIAGDGRAVSFHGDLHPSFAGNVVKAMGGAKRAYPVITRVLERVEPASGADDPEFFAGLSDRLVARVAWVERLTPTIVEVVVKAPQAATMFHPGQFYRLQNYETYCGKPRDTLLAMEPLAMTGAWTDPERGLLSLIVLEMGGSSDLVASLEKDEPVIVMGPTGTPTEIPKDETVLLMGGGLGNAVLFSIGKAMRQAGSRVLYVAGYRKVEDRYKVAEIEQAADTIVWASDEEPGFEPGRPQDRTNVGNIVDTLVAYQEGRLGEVTISLEDVDRIIAIGSDRMMAAVKAARFGVLKDWLKPDHVAIGSINSPMQCMMKEICAQCLQPHVDPLSGERRPPVFSCFNQDQLLDCVDFPGLAQRLAQNGVHEKLTRAWIDRSLRELDLRPAAE
jgi:NAD(P)H-flavin reductase